MARTAVQVPALTCLVLEVAVKALALRAKAIKVAKGINNSSLVIRAIQSS